VATKCAYIGLGSNLGNRVQALEEAVARLQALENTSFKALSGVYESSPVEAEGEPFLNAVAVIETGLRPAMLLETLLKVEDGMGRVREAGKRGSRYIDLDLLLIEDIVIENKDLFLPHPRMLYRRFVMEPLAELAPDLMIPPGGIIAAKAAEDLAKGHPEQEVRRLGTLEEVKEGLMSDV
jgi:2-amino-4-hydroxy-6-hydroxymethyldihydropteridine diphosphokinase